MGGDVVFDVASNIDPGGRGGGGRKWRNFESPDRFRAAKFVFARD